MRKVLLALAMLSALIVGGLADHGICRTEDSVRCVYLPSIQGNMQGSQLIVWNGVK